MGETTTYTVWARDRAEAIAKATTLAEGKGLTVSNPTAERFPEGAMYHVNWKVTLVVAPLVQEAKA